jgi:hypothetical protein
MMRDTSPPSPKNGKKNGESSLKKVVATSPKTATSKQNPSSRDKSEKKVAAKKIPKTKKLSSFDSNDEDPKKVASVIEAIAPEYPSQSTEHFFMTKHFKGNRKDVGKLYKALSKPLKVKTLGAGEAESLKKMLKAFKRQRRLNGKKETEPLLCSKKLFSLKNFPPIFLNVFKTS